MRESALDTRESLLVAKSRSLRTRETQLQSGLTEFEASRLLRSDALDRRERALRERERFSSVKSHSLTLDESALHSLSTQIEVKGRRLDRMDLELQVLHSTLQSEADTLVSAAEYVQSALGGASTELSELCALLGRSVFQFRQSLHTCSSQLLAMPMCDDPLDDPLADAQSSSSLATHTDVSLTIAVSSSSSKEEKVAEVITPLLDSTRVSGGGGDASVAIPRAREEEAVTSPLEPVAEQLHFDFGFLKRDT